MNKKASFELSVILLSTLAVLIFSAGVLVLSPGGITGFVTLNAPSNVSSCNTTINASGEYTLNQSLTSCSGNGVIIDSSNVVLDCNGYAIGGDNTGGDYGVYIGSGLSNVTVRNCTINDFSGTSVVEAGIYSASSATIEFNTLNNNRLGIYMVSGSSGVVNGNTVINSTLDGISYSTTGVTDITNNTITNSGRRGIHLGSQNFRVWHNNIYNNNLNVYAGTWPDEISHNNEGNYWGHSCPNVFTAGTDTNQPTVTDSYPYDTMNGWLTGSPADCVVCGKDINSSTNLTYDLTGCSGNGLNITTSDIVLDCAGYSISGSNTARGIYLSSVDGVTVKNCNISDFTNGIYLDASDNNSLENNHVYNNTGTGMYLLGSNGNNVTGGEIGPNSNAAIAGIRLSSSNSATIKDTYMHNNQYYAIYATSSVYTTVDNNDIDENCGGNAGIAFYSSSDDFLIINNNVTNGTGYGIYVSSSDGQILNNNISGNTNDGIWAADTMLNVSNNTITYNNWEGINFGSSVTANVWHNNIHNNSAPQISSSSAIELSFGEEGNYWGRSSCPVFIPGTDSNNASVVDSYPYIAADGWLSTSPTVCCGGASGDCSCGDTVVGDVLLTSDLSATGDCLTIEADGITIDCDEYTLTGQQNGDGIIINGYDNITVENCEITNFTTNIYFNNSVGNDIINNNVSFDLISNYGIYLSKVNDTLIKDNYVFKNYYGIYLANSSSNTMQDNIILNNSNSGIYLTDSSDDNKIIGGEIGHNNKPSGSSMRGGIRIGSSSRNNITGVYLHDNAYNAIVLLTCENNTIDGNNIDSNCGGNAGIYMQDNADNTVIQNNNITNGTGHGIEIYYSIGSEIINNNISNNSYSGIYMQGGVTSDHIITGNDINGNDEYGIEMYSEDNVTISNNNIFSNNGGIYLVSSTDITIDNNDIQDNSEGIHLSSSQATIINTDFTNNNGSLFTGLYVSSSSTAHLKNGDFIDNGEYGIYNTGGETVNWNITKEITCKNNNLSFWGPYPKIDGGKIILDNCLIYVNNSLWNISSGLEEFNEYGLNITAGATTGLGNSSVGFSVEVTGNENDSVDLSVEEYSSNPGGSGYALQPLGKYLKFETSSPINVSWIIIKVYYTDAEVTAAGLDENSLRLEYYNASSGKWTKYDPPNGGVDTNANYVWAKVTHFSIWGVFGSTPTAPSAPSRGRVTGAVGNEYIVEEEPLTVTLSGIDKVHFVVDGVDHVAQLHSLGEDYVILSMATTVTKVRVNLGQTTKIDVNNDRIYNLAVTLNSINKFSAELTFEKIAEERPAEAPAIMEVAPLVAEVPEEVEEIKEIEKKEMNYLLVILLAALVVIIVIAMYPKAKKKK